MVEYVVANWIFGFGFVAQAVFGTRILLQCDADICHLGVADYEIKSLLLKEELEAKKAAQYAMASGSGGFRINNIVKWLVSQD